MTHVPIIPEGYQESSSDEDIETITAVLRPVRDNIVDTQADLPANPNTEYPKCSEDHVFYGPNLEEDKKE